MQQSYAVAESPYAGFWRRVAAYLIDTIGLGIVLDIIGIPFGVFSTQRGGGIVLWYLIALVGSWLYFALLESSEYQATLGKMALGIVATDLNGQRLTFGRATGRYFGKIISGLICGIGYLLAAFTERKQALHDMIASTLVMKKGAVGAGMMASQPSTYGAPPPPPPPVAPSSGFAGAAPPPAPETAAPPAPANPDIPASEATGEPPADAPGETPPENPPTA